MSHWEFKYPLALNIALTDAKATMEAIISSQGTTIVTIEITTQEYIFRFTNIYNGVLQLIMKSIFNVAAKIDRMVIIMPSILILRRRI